jgi:hypothetical protein
MIAPQIRLNKTCTTTFICEPSEELINHLLIFLKNDNLGAFEYTLALLDTTFSTLPNLYQPNSGLVVTISLEFLDKSGM